MKTKSIFALALFLLGLAEADSIQPLFPDAGLLRSDGQGNVTADTTNYVPNTVKINGTALTGDITIQGMTDNALVLTNSSIKTQSGGTVTPANIGAVANDSTYTTMAGKANNSVQNDSTYQTMAGKANSAVQPETLVQTVNAVKNLHWDPGLQVTWTNVVNNGHIYYVTVTNTNVSVAQ